MKEKMEQTDIQERIRTQRKEDKWKAKEHHYKEDIEYLFYRLNELGESHKWTGIKMQKHKVKFLS